MPCSRALRQWPRRWTGSSPVTVHTPYFLVWSGREPATLRSKSNPLQTEPLPPGFLLCRVEKMQRVNWNGKRVRSPNRLGFSNLEELRKGCYRIYQLCVFYRAMTWTFFISAGKFHKLHTYLSKMQKHFRFKTLFKKGSKEEIITVWRCSLRWPNHFYFIKDCSELFQAGFHRKLQQVSWKIVFNDSSNLREIVNVL